MGWVRLFGWAFSRCFLVLPLVDRKFGTSARASRVTVSSEAVEQGVAVWDARTLRGVPSCPVTTAGPPLHNGRPHNPCREAVQERVVRQIRMLRAMRRELETGLRRLLNGHAGGNPGHGQGAAYGLPRQFPTLPVSPDRDADVEDSTGRSVFPAAALPPR